MKTGEILIIRQENPADYDKVYELIRISFAASSHSDGTAADYLNLMKRVQRAVFEQKGVWLEPEVRILGEEANSP